MIGGPARLWAIALSLALASCGQDPTAASLADIQRAEDEWTTHHLTRYAYQYQTNGFFNTFDGQAIRLVVLGDTVRSAQFVASNDSVPVAPATFPTIDGLFAMALAARRGGTLISVRFDATLAFPTRLEFSGPPDASGTIFASTIEPLP